MTESEQNIELKQLVGALLFGAKAPLRLSEIRKVLKDTAANQGGDTSAFQDVKESEIKRAMDECRDLLVSSRVGITLAEVAGAYRIQTDPSCGPWVREMLAIGKPARLSHPALETLAIIAYRQPVSRSEVEAVRGVNVDAMVRNLLELQLIKIVGRSDLPGRPLLYGTTQKFLEHFGLSNIKDLPGIQQLSRRVEELRKKDSGEPDAGSDPDEAREEADEGV